MNRDLPEVLALLHTSGRRWRTLRAEGEEWQDERGSREAFARLRRPGSVMTMRGGPGSGRADRDPRWRVWIHKPDRARVEFGGAHQVRFTQITDGERRWMSLPDGSARVDERPGQPRLQVGPVDVLVETASLSAGLDLEVTGRNRILGRETFSVRGRRRDSEFRPGPGGFHPFLEVADEVRLEVDAERGVVLRLQVGDFFRQEMSEVAFDEELADDIFAFPPADEASTPTRPEEVRPPRPRPPSLLHPGPPEDVLGVTTVVDAVLARTPSVVVALDRVVAYPAGFELHVTVRTRDQQPMGTVEPAHPRTWGGSVAFPGESLRLGVAFSDGRAASAANFSEPPRASGVTLIPLSGGGTGARFDQRYWVQPLPPAGPLGFVVEWTRRGIPETRTEVSADAILEAASRARRIWD